MEKKLPIDLYAMSSKELQDLQNKVNEALKDAVTRERALARQAAEQAAAEFGFSLADVLGGQQGGARKSDEKSVSPPKYRNPENSAQTWTGRGRKPGWFVEALAGGATPEDLEI